MTNWSAPGLPVNMTITPGSLHGLPGVLFARDPVPTGLPKGKVGPFQGSEAHVAFPYHRGAPDTHPTMKFTIDEGRIHVWSDDEAVHLIILPRRSLMTEPTRVQVRSEPMPMFEVEPELAEEIKGDWVWSGLGEDAVRIVDMTCAALTTRLDPAKAASPRARAWRTRVLTSIHGESLAGSKSAATR